VREPLLRRLFHLTTLYIEAPDATPLAAAGFTDYDRFRGERPATEERESRNVRRIQAGPRSYFLKAYAYRGVRILRTFLYRAKAEREFENLGRVAEAGVPAVRPVAWGVRRVLGFIPHSFLLTESFDGSSNGRELIAAYVTSRPASVSRQAFRTALNSVIDGLRALHARGIYLHTAFEKNLLVRLHGATPEYAWVDLPFAGRYPPGSLPLRRRVRDLACLDKGLEWALTAPDRLRLLRRYLGPDATREQLRDLATRVLHKTRVLRDETPLSRLIKTLKGG
jgi:hypothetical protein